MKQRQQLGNLVNTRLSQQTKILIGVGVGMLLGAAMAIIVLRADLSGNQSDEPAQQEEIDPATDSQRRPPAVIKGGTLRTLPEDSLGVDASPGSVPPVR